ncbi:MAG: DUF2157 domain-containing protein [Lentisphaeria bacterium]|jgi:uncharacterized membrane protein
MKERERNRWLHEQLAGWEREGIVQSDQAAVLRGRYPLGADDSRFGVMLFGGIGVVVLGLGVILMFAYNWAEMSKISKLAVIFGALLAAHGVGYCLRYLWSRPILGDVFGLLGTMFFGAAIFLIAQIYHISSHYPNAFWYWGLGAMAMAWAVPSLAQGLLANVVLTIWAGMELCGFHEPMLLRPLAVIIASGALAWHLRSKVLMLASGVSAYFIVCFLCAYRADTLFPYVILLLGGLYAAKAEGLALYGDTAFPAAGSVLSKLAVAGLLFASYLLGFDWFHDDLYRELRQSGGMAEYVSWALAALSILSLLGVMVWGQRRGRGSWRRLLWPLLATLVATICVFGGYLGLGGDGDGVTMAKTLVFHALYVIPVLMILWTSCDDGDARQVLNFALLLALWVFTRYCDWFENLFTRGVAFVLFGAFLFYLSIRYHRRKKLLTAEGGSEHA